MKRTVLILGIALLAVATVAAFCISAGYFTPVTEFSAIRETETAGDYADAAGDEDAPRLLFGYGGATLPETSEGEVLIPAIPASGLTVTTERGATLSKIRTGEREWRVTAEKNGRARAVTLKETGIGVCTLAQNETDIQSEKEPIGDEKSEAELALFYIDDNGALAVDRCRVSATIRGRTNRYFAKKAYTITVEEGSGRNGTRSLMGLPADTKFQLNCLYEDESKIRDVLSLGLWQQMISPDDGVDALRLRYTELFINGEYRGLYAFGQVITPVTAGLADGDGLVKLPGPMNLFVNSKTRPEVIRDALNIDLSEAFTQALALLCDGDEAALSLFDTENLLRVFLFVQFTYASDNCRNNLAAAWHADRGIFTLLLFDTDQTFGLQYTYSAPRSHAFNPEVAGKDLMEEAASVFTPISGILRFNGRFKQPLAELYFSFRESFLTEEKLLATAKELFDTVIESGAAERDYARWPDSAYTETNEALESYIVERLAWCDEYFTKLCEEGAAETAAAK